MHTLKILKGWLRSYRVQRLKSLDLIEFGDEKRK
jgi:hypothetical protein